MRARKAGNARVLAGEDLTGQDDSRLRRRRLNEKKCRVRRLDDLIMGESCGACFNCILVFCHKHLPHLSSVEPALPRKLTFQDKIKIVVTKTSKIFTFKPPNFIACRVCVHVCVCSCILYTSKYCYPLHSAAAAQRRGLASFPEAAFFPAATVCASVSRKLVDLPLSSPPNKHLISLHTLPNY